MPLGEDPLIDYAVERIAQRLARARRRRGMSQAAVGDMIGLSRPSVANFEGGRQDIPISRVLAYVMAVHADPVEIFWPVDDGGET